MWNNELSNDKQKHGCEVKRQHFIILSSVNLQNSQGHEHNTTS
jgi:hypothetical protein